MHDCKSYLSKLKVWFQLSKGGSENLPKNLEKKIGRYVPVHLNLGEKTYLAIKQYANRNEMSISDVIRIATNDWCSRKGFFTK